MGVLPPCPPSSLHGSCPASAPETLPHTQLCPCPPRFLLQDLGCTHLSIPATVPCWNCHCLQDLALQISTSQLPVPARALHALSAQTLPAAPPAPCPASLAPSPVHPALLPLQAALPSSALGLQGSPPWNSANSTWSNTAWTWVQFLGPKARRSPSHSLEKGQHWRCAQSTALRAQAPCGKGIVHRLPSSQTHSTHPEPAMCGELSHYRLCLARVLAPTLDLILVPQG